MRALRMFIGFYFISFQSVAVATESIDLREQTKAIYWLDTTERYAISYRRFAGYLKLITFISDSIIPKNGVEQSHCDNSQIDTLIIYGQEQNHTVQFYQNCLSFDGEAYSVNSAQLDNLREMNQFRIEKGDSTSARHVFMVKNRTLSDP